MTEPYAEPIDSDSRSFRRPLAAALLALAVVLTGLAIWLGVTEWFARPTRHYKAPVPGISIPVLGFVRDLKFRPDGRQLAVLQQRDRIPDCIATILDFPSGTVVRNIFDAARGVMAWSPDGSSFAVGHHNANSVDVWNAQTWRLERSLSFRVRRDTPDDVYAIGLDCEGTVYASQGVADRGPFPSTDPPLHAWRLGSTIPETIGSLGDAFDLAVGCLADRTRVVISYDRGPDVDAVEVWQIRRPAHGQPTVTKQYVLPGLHLSRIALTHDGTTLVAQDENAVRVYRLGTDHADLTCTLDARLGRITVLQYVRPVISPNNQFIAFRCGGRAASVEEAHIVVARLPKGEIVFEAKPGMPLDFAPDSKLLAVCENGLMVAYAVDKR